MIIENLFDSHTHFLSTGEFLSGLDLKLVKSKSDLVQLPLKPSSYRGDWLVGFGWNENQFTDLTLDLKTLDAMFPNTPVFFSRTDGHTSWLNTLAFKKLNLHPQPQGLLKEKDHIQALLSLPPYSMQQKRHFFKTAMDHYNRQGFTHIRDMASSAEQFELGLDLEKKSGLTLHMIHNFICEDKNDFSRALNEARACERMETNLLKVAGLKFFFDGSLGSETALLSIPYNGKTEGPQGVTQWRISDLEEVMQKTWQEGLEVSVHTIGDEAAHQVVLAARRISAGGVAGVLNLEHVQVLRPETIQAMKSLHVVCHMQPCHWLSDQVWLKEKLGPVLYVHAFPWESLRSAKVPLYFGSDSPIEPAVLMNNLRALKESARHKIKKFNADPLHFHVSTKYPLARTFCRINAQQEVEEVYFLGKQII